MYKLSVAKGADPHTVRWRCEACQLTLGNGAVASHTSGKKHRKALVSGGWGPCLLAPLSAGDGEQQQQQASERSATAESTQHGPPKVPRGGAEFVDGQASHKRTFKRPAKRPASLALSEEPSAKRPTAAGPALGTVMGPGKKLSLTAAPFVPGRVVHTLSSSSLTSGFLDTLAESSGPTAGVLAVAAPLAAPSLVPVPPTETYFERLERQQRFYAQRLADASGRDDSAARYCDYGVPREYGTRGAEVPELIDIFCGSVALGAARREAEVQLCARRVDWLRHLVALNSVAGTRPRTPPPHPRMLWIE
eukprot:1434867-Prymnesium_polylepis.2